VAEVETGRVIRFIAALVLVALVASAILLTVSAARQNARADQLRHHGVPVEVTATGCAGISSGVAMAIEYWECRGTYTLRGHGYNEVIGGSRVLLRPGQKLRAVAVPGAPSLLSTPAVAAGAHSRWTLFVTPIILGAVSLAMALVWVVWWRRRHSDSRGSAALG
jgi:hypothetical protein